MTDENNQTENENTSDSKEDAISFLLIILALAAMVIFWVSNQ